MMFHGLAIITDVHWLSIEAIKEKTRTRQWSLHLNADIILGIGS